MKYKIKKLLKGQEDNISFYTVLGFIVFHFRKEASWLVYISFVFFIVSFLIGCYFLFFEKHNKDIKKHHWMVIRAVIAFLFTVLVLLSIF